MKSLRQRFCEFMQFKNLAEKTQESYIQALAKLSAHYGTSPDRLDNDRIIQYILYLTNEKKQSFSTCNVALSAFKCFYNQFLNNGTLVLKVPSRKRPKRLPVVYSRQEVERIIQSTPNPKHRIILMTAYGTGLRLKELVNLQVKDIDSGRMTVFVQNSKGQKDRYTVLPKTLLEELRSYYQVYRPKDRLFYSIKPDRPVHVDTVSRVFRQAKQKAGVEKPGGVHTLRHCFATHLLKNGTDIRTVQHLLGHADIASTMVYLHITDTLIAKVVSPLETLELTSVDPFRPETDDEGDDHE